MTFYAQVIFLHYFGDTFLHHDVDFDDICPRLFYFLSCFLPFLLSMHDVCMPYALPFVSMTLPLLFVDRAFPRYSDPQGTMSTGKKVKQARFQAQIRQQPIAVHSG